MVQGIFGSEITNVNDSGLNTQKRLLRHDAQRVLSTEAHRRVCLLCPKIRVIFKVLGTTELKHILG